LASAELLGAGAPSSLRAVAMHSALPCTVPNPPLRAQRAPARAGSFVDPKQTSDNASHSSVSRAHRSYRRLGLSHL
jgi:hypothetical protein